MDAATRTPVDWWDHLDTTLPEPGTFPDLGCGLPDLPLAAAVPVEAAALTAAVIFTMDGKQVDWTRPPSAKTRVRWSKTTSGGQPVTGSLRTIAHFAYLDAAARAQFGVGIVVIQPPFNTTVKASAGTHDFDCCVDLFIPGVDWWDQQRFFRAHGLGCWFRHPPLFGFHIHGFTLPVPEGRVRSDDFATRVGVFVPGQLIDYYNHAFGLAGQHTPGLDRSWFPPNIDATVFNLPAYIRTQATIQEDDVSAEDVWNYKVKPVDGSNKPIAAGSMLAQAHNRALDARTLARAAVTETRANRAAISALAKALGHAGKPALAALGDEPAPLDPDDDDSEG